ncbi:SdrD B-like domain-containing protein, partial [Erysipelothrix tonsillarum]
MKGIKKHLVTLLSAVLMMTSLGIAPALADEAPLGNDDFNIVVNKKLNPKDLTLDLKIKLEDKNPTTPKVVSDLSQVFKDEGKENEKLDLVKDKTNEYEMVVSENGEVEFELNYSKEVKAAEGEAEAINRDEKHNFKVNVTEIEEAKAEEPKVEEPKAEEPKVQEPVSDEDVVDVPKASADGITTYGVDGTVTVDIEDYTPALGWNLLDQKNVKINVDFKDQTSSDKILKITIPSEFEYKRYPVKGMPSNGIEETMSGVLDSLVETSESANMDFHGSYGTITYKFKPTTEKAEIQFSVAPHISTLNPENVLNIKLEAELSKAGVKVDSVESIVDLDGKFITLISTLEGNRYYDIEASLGETNPLSLGKYQVLGRIARKEGDQLINTIKYYDEVEFTRYYPIGAKFVGFTDTSNPATVTEVNDAQGFVKYKLVNPQGNQWVGIDVDVRDLPEGDHFAPNNNEVKVTFHDGTQKTVDINRRQNIKIIDTSVLPNSLNIVVNDGIYADISPNYTIAGPRFRFETKAKEVKNQFISLDIEPDLIVDKVRIPIGTSGNNSVNFVNYRTNISGSTVKKAVGPQIIKTNSYFEINNKSLGLGQNEHITFIEAELGDFKPNYSTNSSINYIRANDSNIISSKLKPGVSSAKVKIKTYSKNSSNTIDTSSITEQTGIVTRKNLNDTKSSMRPEVMVSPMVAGDSQYVRFTLDNSHYYYADNAATKNPTLLLVEKAGYYYDLEKIKIRSQDVKTGELKDLSFDVERRLHPNGIDNLVEINIKGNFGTFFDKAQLKALVDIELKSTGIANINSYYSEIAFWSLDAKKLVEFNGYPKIINDVDDLNRDGSITDHLLPVHKIPLIIFPKEELSIDTYIVPQGGSRQPAYDATLQNAVGFIPGSMSTYYVNILNNRKDTVKEIITYIPVPKTGMNLGVDFQDNKFEWDMTLANSPKIKVADAAGNDVTAVKSGNYVIEFTSDAIDSTNYKTASYGNSFDSDTKMIRVTNTSNSIEAGEHAELKFDFEISETDITKVGKINDFRPFYSFEDTGNKGVEHGTRVGAELVIGEVSGVVFEDKNMNGIYDAGDTPATGRTVDLCKVDASGTGCESTSTTTTQSDGSYKFTGLNNGNYTVDFNSAKKADEEFTFKGVGIDPMKDSDVSIVGTDRGIVKNISSTQSSGQEVTVGFIKYDVSKLDVTTNDKNVQILESLGANIFEKDLAPSIKISPSIFDTIKDTDGAITWSSSDVSTVTVSNGVIQGKKPGNAVVTVTIKDMYGNVATETINVEVVKNNIPVLTLTSSNEAVEINSIVNLKNYIATASDIEDGLTANDVVISPSTINTSTLGSQTITYKLKDSHNNEVTKALVITVYNSVDPTNKEAVNAHDFNIKLSDVNATNVLAGAEAKGFNLNNNPATDEPVTVVSVLPTTIGDHKV